MTFRCTSCRRTKLDTEFAEGMRCCFDCRAARTKPLNFTSKRCSRCDKTKPLAEFIWEGKSFPRCSDCQATPPPHVKRMLNKFVNEEIKRWLIAHPGATRKECAYALKLGAVAARKHINAIRAEWGGM